ncbi:hypothetical protein EON67_11245 [archaeon]|nr:MAG: hypothetical protein EON67_11245 [archaeon]
MADGEYTPGFEEEEEAPFGSALPPRAGMKRNRAAFGASCTPGVPAVYSLCTRPALRAARCVYMRALPGSVCMCVFA